MDLHIFNFEFYTEILYFIVNPVSLFFQKTPLHIAAQKNNIEIIKLLLENKNINVNKCDEV